MFQKRTMRIVDFRVILEYFFGQMPDKALDQANIFRIKYKIISFLIKTFFRHTSLICYMAKPIQLYDVFTTNFSNRSRTF